MRKLALLVMMFVLSAVAHAQVGKVKPGDARIRKILEEKEFKYKITDAGNFSSTFDISEGRTHQVFINSGTQTYRGMELREIWAIGVKSKGIFPATTANTLLEDTERRKLGAWKVLTEGEEHFAVFFVVVDADADAETLVSAMKIVMEVADEIELKIVGTDDF